MRFSVLAWPGGTPSISPTAPLSLASLPLSRLPAGFADFRTTNSCLTVPMFVTTNLTLPFGAPWVPGKTLNSSTWTATRGFEVTASPFETEPETATTVTAAIPTASSRIRSTPFWLLDMDQRGVLRPRRHQGFDPARSGISRTAPAARAPVRRCDLRGGAARQSEFPRAAVGAR